MKNVIKTIVLVFGISLFTANSSYGQNDKKQERKEPPTFAKLLKEMDANDDGKLSKKEIKGPLKNDFAKVDTDEDGFISEKEFEKAPKPEKGERPQGRRN
jgi:Ca2+-binding EF-hand superfamily protein